MKGPKWSSDSFHLTTWSNEESIAPQGFEVHLSKNIVCDGKWSNGQIKRRLKNGSEYMPGVHSVNQEELTYGS